MGYWVCVEHEEIFSCVCATVYAIVVGRKSYTAAIRRRPANQPLRLIDLLNESERKPGYHRIRVNQEESYRLHKCSKIQKIARKIDNNTQSAE